MKKLLLPILGFLPLLTIGGGFQVNLQGTKQTGMGHLGTSFYLGASSAYFNPAMMGMDSSKVSIEAGASFIFSSVGFQNQDNGREEFTDNPTGTPFYLYGTYKINDNLSAGLAVYTPYGSSVDWGENWSGRYLIQDISLRAIYIQPTLSYKISDDIRVGVGATIVNGSFEINRALATPIGNNATANLEGSETAYGYNVGLHYQITEKLSLGVTYRSKVEVELEDGDVDFTVDPSLESSFPDGKFAATLPLVATATIGVAYQATDALLVSAEINMVEWGEYESLDFDFANNTDNLEDSQNPRNYEDANIYRIGAQYTASEMLDLRVGFYYDESPIQDEYFNPETPNSNNLGFTAGLSYHANENFTVDASFLYISGQERESEYQPSGFGGKYRSNSVIPGIGLNYKF